jgi:hypothetical protein
MGSFIALYGLAESAALIRTVLAGKNPAGEDTKSGAHAHAAA